MACRRVTKRGRGEGGGLVPFRLVRQNRWETTKRVEEADRNRRTGAAVLGKNTVKSLGISRARWAVRKRQVVSAPGACRRARMRKNTDVVTCVVMVSCLGARTGMGQDRMLHPGGGRNEDLLGAEGLMAEFFRRWAARNSSSYRGVRRLSARKKRGKATILRCCGWPIVAPWMTKWTKRKRGRDPRAILEWVCSGTLQNLWALLVVSVQRRSLCAWAFFVRER